MRMVLVLAWLSACVSRYPVTRVTLFDRSEVTGTLPESHVVDNDVLLAGRSADVLAFDGDTLRMKVIEGCGYRRRCTPLELHVDTPLANVRTIRDVGVASHQVIPLGLLTGTIFTVVGGGLLLYAEHDGGQKLAPAMALAAGLTILALEIHARLVDDTVTVVRH